MSIGRNIFEVSRTFTRPADITAYTFGDQVADNTVAGSVTAFNFAVPYLRGRGGVIRNAIMVKSTNVITNADFRLQLFSSSFTQAGDNAALAPTLTELRSNLGYFVFANALNIQQFSNGAHYGGYPFGAVQQWALAIPESCDGTLYGAITAAAAYTPTASEQFTIRLIIESN